VAASQTYHTWQFIIFTIFTITACIFSYLLSISFWTQNLALQQILPSIDLFLSYWTDSTDSRTIEWFFSAQRQDLFEWCVSRLLVGFRTHFKSLHFHSFIQTCASWRQQSDRLSLSRWHSVGCVPMYGVTGGNPHTKLNIQTVFFILQYSQVSRMEMVRSS